jgi:membrane protein DedA with SNARE-associated domain
MHQHWLTHLALQLVGHLGYAGLAIGLLLNTLGIPLPSEVLLPAASVAVRQGHLNVTVVAELAIVAQLIGALIGHFIGQRGGVPLLKRYGRYVLLSHHDLERAHRWFERYGSWAVVLGYCLPFVRGYMGYAAGVAELTRSRFLLGALIGISVWTLALTMAGYYVAGNLNAIENVIGPFTDVLVAAVVLAFGYMIWKRLRERPA